jgi:uncharacterized Zn finger protein (UPF0148 family)
MQDPTPILCTACGGPAVSAGDVSAQCPYCDTRDVLPREGHARARELQRRLAQDMAAHRRQLTDAATRTAAMGRRRNLLCFKAFAGMFTTTYAFSWLIQMFLR